MPAAKRPGSTWSVRTSEELGVQISNRQLAEYETWELIDRSSDGWAPGTTERLVKIRAAGAATRSLPRRVIRLYVEEHGFSVSATTFRRALVATAPTIVRPIRKITLVARARASMSTIAAADPVRPGGLPRHDEWGEILSRASDGTIARYQFAWVSQARDVMPIYGERVGVDLREIAIEERIVMVAVLDLILPSRALGPPTIIE